MEIINGNERRKALDNKIAQGFKLDENEIIEAVILLAFNNEGHPRDFTPLELRLLIRQYQYFESVLNFGVE